MFLVLDCMTFMHQLLMSFQVELGWKALATFIALWSLIIFLFLYLDDLVDSNHILGNGFRNLNRYLLCSNTLISGLFSLWLDVDWCLFDHHRCHWFLALGSLILQVDTEPLTKVVVFAWVVYRAIIRILVETQVIEALSCDLSLSKM